MTLVDRDPEEIRAAISEARDTGDRKALATLTEGLRAVLAWKPLPHQQVADGDWFLDLLCGGRGVGKTDRNSYWLDQHMSGPPCDRRVPGGHRASIIAPTLADAVAAAVDGPSGIRAHNPGVEKSNRKEGTFCTWPNGAEARLFGAHTLDDADRLRAGGNVCAFALEEVAMMRHLRTAYDNLRLGARLGPHPQGVGATTPKSRPDLVAIMGDQSTRVVQATTFDNPHLPASVVSELRRLYEGTRLGRQELYGELLADFEGALWRRDVIVEHRVDHPGGTGVDVVRALGLVKVYVGIDPSTWDPELGADPGTVGEGLETGIVVAGIDAQDPPHVFVLEDASLRAQAEAWARRAVGEYRAWGANAVVPEVNLGGMVLSTIRLVAPDVSIFRDGTRVGVRAAHAKRARAEPVAALYEQGRCHHVGEFPELESQMVGWDPREAWSPDRIDALVWAVYACAPWRSSGSAVSTARQVMDARIPVR